MTAAAAHRPAAPSTLAALRDPRLLTREALAGLVVAVALIPEAIAFSLIAGVDPRVGLFSAFVMATSIAVLGGRPAMISAATGAVALVIAPVMREHGLDYLLATVILGGVIQIVLAALGVGRLMRFIPRSVMTGFVNALAVLVFATQIPHLIGVPWLVYPMLVVGIGIIWLFPRLTGAVPAPLVAIVVLTAAAILVPLAVPTVGDEGALPESLPVLALPSVPLTLETLGIIGPYALGMAAVGLMESLLTATLVDEITETGSSKTRESFGQGAANVLSGLFGGMGGCAMIGQTMVNVKVSGARTRVSTFLAGVFLLVLVLALGDVVALVPMVALVAVMIMVSVATFDWDSVRPSTLRRTPLAETVVMLLTVAAVLITHNLAIGVAVGVLAAMIAFTRQVSRFLTVTRLRSVDTRGAVVDYRVDGQLFFASSNDLTTRFDVAEDPERVRISFSGAQIWDASSVTAIGAVLTAYRRHGAHVELSGLRSTSTSVQRALDALAAGARMEP
ncbi:SulP family inorganic anion transporter [Mycetocola reblochoni]|uniref:Sulfate permease n=2 Tax=Mycetocola reblochoni TaxID=331618 RepID=A0A1R4ISJ3_9MICO|nr:SulP family inorganic anion transporter [Mycetocola reblochoni]RLP71083.1 SulP family inorganic anion transporter [Mycetocola reblochoni]SJN22820.1 Sulfate permease [Mycetocola reblochoni REB411]